MGASRTRSRRPKGGYENVISGTVFGSGDWSEKLRLLPWEITTDEEHDWYWWRTAGRRHFNALHGAPLSSPLPLDIGGPFSSEKFLIDSTDYPYWSGRYYYADSWRGPLNNAGNYTIDGKNSSSWGSLWGRPSPSDTTFLLGLGGTAISRCKPTNPNASLLSGLIELRRDGLPSVPFASTRKNGVPGVAEDYLNYEFAIKPLLNDIKSVRKSCENAQKILRQYRRDSGRMVRRTYSFPVDTQSVSQVTSTNTTVGPGSLYAYQQPWGRTTLNRTTKTSYRFSGAFTYQGITDVDDRISWLGKKIQEANHLLGLAPTPEVFWNTLPWSWFVDWFTNIGDVVSNISSILVDGLVVNWGYLTEVIEVESQFVTEGVVMNDGFRPTPKTTYKYKSTRRIRATPYGFGFDMQTLSARQFAILASLGITQGGRWKAM